MTGEGDHTQAAGDPVLPISRISHQDLRADPGAAELTRVLGRLFAETDGTADAPVLRAMARHLPFCVWTVTAEGTIGSSFGQALVRLGLADGELEGTPVAAWGSEGEAHIRRALDGEPVSFDSEGVFGGRAWALHHLVVPLDGGGAAGISIDRTERLLVRRQLGASEGRFRVLATSAPIGIFLADPTGANVYVNPALVEQFARPEDEVLGMGWAESVHPGDRGRIDEHRAGSRERGEPFDMEYRIVRPDGEQRWLHVLARRLFDEDGGHTGYVGITRDVTDQRDAENSLRASEEINRAILETAAEGIFTVGLEGDLRSFNRAAQDIFGWTAEEVVGSSVGVLLPENHRDVYLGLLRSFRETGDATLAGSPPRELHALRKDGSSVPVELALTEVRVHDQVLFTGLVRDISERRAFENQLEHQATHDQLTSLPNRALLAAQLESALARAYRHGTSVAVLFVSLDRIKVVTDSLGHRAGDELRVAAAHRLQGVVRPVDTVTRFGEDEFVVLAEDLEDLPDAVEVAQRIIDAMDVSFDLTIDEAYITCNVGISFAVEGLGTAESLIADADLAMFRAREQGGGHLEIFDSEMRAWINDRRKTEVALRHALDLEEFELHYQPIVSVGDGHLKGFEALVRWNRGTLGMVSPGSFIPVAEDSGLIVPIGEWILDEACRQVAAWQRASVNGAPTVSVNLSGRQLAQRGIAEVVARSVAEAGADPGGLNIEITETVLLDDVDQAVRTLGSLKDIGVRLSIDDFGTGYSSLTYLRRFPIDIVKIDQSFVATLGCDHRDDAIVGAVITLAGGLDLDVVAEGVETSEQLAALAGMACDYAQGYLFSRPRPVDDLGDYTPR